MEINEHEKVLIIIAIQVLVITATITTATIMGSDLKEPLITRWQYLKKIEINNTEQMIKIIQEALIISAGIAFTTTGLLLNPNKDKKAMYQESQKTKEEIARRLANQLKKEILNTSTNNKEEIKAKYEIIDQHLAPIYLRKTG